jgi:prepilin-type N-terminal cleavage/methylation domain-containing protein
MIIHNLIAQKKFKSGFTLIELLVVIVIIGVLAGIGAIGYSQYIENTNNAAVSSNLANVASALGADIVSNNLTCEDIAIAQVMNMINTMKNPFSPGDQTSVAAYGNYMTQNAPTGIAQTTPIKKGSIVVSCSDPDNTPNDPDFAIYECSCDTDTCHFGDDCPIPTPSQKSGDPYSPS